MANIAPSCEDCYSATRDRNCGIAMSTMEQTGAEFWPRWVQICCPALDYPLAILAIHYFGPKMALNWLISV